MDLENPQQMWYALQSSERDQRYSCGNRISAQIRKSLESTAFLALHLPPPVVTHAELNSSKPLSTFVTPVPRSLRLELLRLSFRTKTLRNLCERNNVAVELLGEIDAALLHDALAELRAAPAIADIPRWNQRLVQAGGLSELRFEFAGSVIIHFEANHIRMPTDSRNQLAWERVTSIKILKVEQTHG